MDQYVASPEALTRIAARIALAAGDRIYELRRRGVAVAALKSSAVDMVTEADQEAERMIVSALLAERPDDGVLGEEGSNTEGTSGITWIIDPIDGTTNYFYDIPAYAVSIAATVADPEWSNERFRTIAGAVYNPSTRELFEAWEGGGARLNGDAIAPSGTADPAVSLVGTGFGYTVERKVEQLEMVQRLLPRVRDLRRIGSAAYDLCLVACGRLDAYYERGLNAWDYAAGMLIAKEAGAAVIGRDPLTPPGTEMLYAASPGLAENLRAIATGTE
ncbi:inositol monophosphatase family protein [Leucobacter sp. gxy201]|uniref:inositol monophosphatase family protein n=1 Tax=Leucobacter sp. gxy201 TaxID=2957200 RepID=UPI003DA0155F